MTVDNPYYNEVESTEWYQKAAINGDAKSQTHIGYHFADLKDDQGAIMWFEAAANN